MKPRPFDPQEPNDPQGPFTASELVVGLLVAAASAAAIFFALTAIPA